MICGRCGAALPAGLAACPHCGQAFAAPAVSMAKPIYVPPGTHSVALVVVLSVLFGGWVGMLINKQVAKGLLIGLLAQIVVAVVTCGYGLILTGPVVLIDAILIANKLNRGQAVGEWEWF